ncbi:MAG: hypothetical protein DSZ00_00715 [Gammaproteobacteria bacterium]|nr:MAG: hypothetical protein DSZ02_07685 [Gammaproteobacteria bacterium]RTZ76077.1 MAG: hypothetical protein DSZ00_00715 [Gammaproteobacteria bacterium]RTZ81921.1 MAG: hypothetical protein DSZ01_00040 [Gammaproteobacteria bacterium]
MRTAIAITALTLVSSLAIAEDFTYERQWASEDLASETSTLGFRASDPVASMGTTVISLHEVYRGNPDVETIPEDFRQENAGASKSYCNTGYDRIAQANPDLSPNC